MCEDQSPYCLAIVLTTESNQTNADNLAKNILERRLAACISFRDIYSRYWWKDSLETSEEVQLLIKTKRTHVKQVISIIKEFHTYELPEILYWVPRTTDNYYQWMSEVITSPDQLD